MSSHEKALCKYPVLILTVPLINRTIELVGKTPGYAVEQENTPSHAFHDAANDCKLNQRTKYITTARRQVLR